LLPISSCHSSTITVCTWPNSSRAPSRVSIRLSDSGVVTSVVGKRRSCLARSAGAVSPVRMPIDHDSPRSSSGACIARAESAASARIGVSQSTPQRRRSRCSCFLCGRERHAERRGSGERAEPDRVGLARAGGRVQQAALAGGHRRPDFALEVERAPAAFREPRARRHACLPAPTLRRS
jgi:hypothetical protein